MNALGLKEDLLRKVYIEDASALSGAILDGLESDVLTAVNQGFQYLWTAPFDYFRRKDYNFPTVSGTPSYTLDQGIQDILGPVKVNAGTPHLRPVMDRGDFDNYHTRFKGSMSNTATDAQPEAYFLERLNRNEADSALVKMFLTPTPDTAYTINFQASVEAPVMTLADLDAGIDLPVPHNYVESVLLPICRMFVTRSHFFLADKRQADLAAITSDYQLAGSQIGYADPQVVEHKESLPLPK